MRSFVAFVLRELRRPSRIRSRILTSLIIIASVLFVFLGRRHAYEIQQTASSLGHYVPSKLSGAFAPHYAVDVGRWDDTISSNDTDTNVVRPIFHLIIPARRRSINLCRSLLSAAILNYPPPTLIGFELEGKGPREQAAASPSQYLQHTLDFLSGRDVQDDDIVLILNEDTWLQLPAEITIGRFLTNLRDASASLLKQYGRTDTDTVLDNKTTPLHIRPQKYTQRVLFAAQKQCSTGNPPVDPTCYANTIPQSHLPKKIYGKETDRQQGGRYSRPRFIEGSLSIGRAGDVKKVWRRAEDLAQSHHKHGATLMVQDVLTRIFGEQEWDRVRSRRASSTRFRIWLEGKLGYDGSGRALVADDGLLGKGGVSGNREFGIGLDYSSEIFQTMGNARDDVRFVEFGEEEEGSRKGRMGMGMGMGTLRGFVKGRLRGAVTWRGDLEGIGGPLQLCGGAGAGAGAANETGSGLAEARESGDVSWKDVQLATNIIVPRGGVPASLDLRGRPGEDDEGERLREECWGKMWWRKWSRTLLRRCLSAVGAQAWKGSVGAEDGWWDLRGGRGGVWTGKGEWIEWAEVCGEFEGSLFGDAG
ncbi:hypothetical protein MFRU_020g01240 [Monilinia fructicola]|nr:hypothetical protein MFRU_020g01240 [Monilinia fructicola]